MKPTGRGNTMEDSSNKKKITRTREEWKARLTPEEFRVLRDKGTDPPFRNEYNDFYKKGLYVCRGCGQDRKSTRLNSSHVAISYAVFCLKKKMKQQND